MGITIINFGCGSDSVHSIDPEPPIEPVDKEVIMEVWGQSFMSLNVIDDRFMAGTYCFPGSIAQIHCEGYGIVDTIDVGESIFRIEPDHGYVYLACEYEWIYRDIIRTDPMKYDFQPYKQLKRGYHAGAFDVKRLLGELVFIGGGEIYTDGYGTSEEWDDEYFVKFGFQCQDTAFVAGYSYELQSAGWFRSENCIDWEWENIGPKYSRFMQAAITEDEQFIYLVGTNNYKNGHNHNAATLWRYEVSSGILIQLWNFEGFDYISCIRISDTGRIYFILTKGWRSQESGAQLVYWDGRKPYPIAEFEEGEGREIIIKGKYAYCTTRKDKVRGKVTKVYLKEEE
ncbi:hypothetical protein LCGC14_1630370 [marine sediment metagenome]|uniref:Uncharacterized protein n=1 Tax=marine sediment metagenome TaxID=412755 RepID=A0A0F9KIE6_9ZZZZ